jgi:hypothetical protein
MAASISRHHVRAAPAQHTWTSDRCQPSRRRFGRTCWHLGRVPAYHKSRVPYRRGPTTGGRHVFDLENRRVNCVVHASAFSLVSSQLICYLASKVANQKVPAGFFKVDHSSLAIQATMIPVRRDSTWLRVRTAVGRGNGCCQCISS